LTADSCAREVLDAVPTVMRFIRSEMRGHRTPGLSVPQFRTLLYIHRNEGASLMSVSGHLGLTPATTSTLVDGLCRRGLLQRGASLMDRRRVTLALTASGRKAMESTLLETQKSLGARLEALQPGEMRTLTEAMHCLRRVFAVASETAP
jgi:DNA-binding MarR family transcriptional regulator